MTVQAWLVIGIITFGLLVYGNVIMAVVFGFAMVVVALGWNEYRAGKRGENE